ncbi:N-acetylmuramoyl-L-alanine amidase [Corynebacterium striatum]|nr:N-acetylmuramoyl-L-alanine amidase [Corynebacterium striatum]
MKDWKTLEPDRVRLLSRHFTPGRGGQKIKHVTIHHMAMIGGLDECWNVWQQREASAHYTVSPTGEIGQAVWDRDTPWANANLLSNQQTIAIEHSNSGGAAQDWPIGEKTLEEGAHLVAAICVYYKLGRPVSGGNVRFHSIESGGSTGCPYHLRPGGKYHDSYIRRAQYWYDHMTGAAPAPKKEGTPMTLTQKHFTDFITGYLGPQIKAIQEIWTQLRGPGGKGWEQLGQNAQGQNLTLVDAIAALRADVARIEKKIEETK